MSDGQLEATVTTRVRVAVARSRRRRSRSKKLVLGLIGVVAYLLVWEGLSRFGIINPDYLPPASEVFLTFFQNASYAEFWGTVGHTLTTWALGMLISLVLGAGLGIVIGLSPFMRRATRSTFDFLRPIPSVALIPLAVLLFAVPLQQSLLIVVFGAVWQILFQTLYGVADVDTVMMSTARSFGFSWLQRVRDVVLPTMLPYLMTGVRLASSVSLILAVTCELLLATPGLGNDIAKAKDNGLYESLYALVLATGVLGIVLNVAMRALERWLLSWHQSIRTEAVT